MVGFGTEFLEFELVPKALSFRKTGAGCFSVVPWKVGMSAGGLGASTVWTLISLVNLSSRRSPIRGLGKLRNGSRVGFVERASNSSAASVEDSRALSPDRKTLLVNDFNGMSSPPRLEVAVALMGGLPARAELNAGLELDGALGFLVAAEELSSVASSFLENILENGFANAGFFIGSASAGASSLWQ